MPSLGDELLTNARLVDGGAKVILVIIVIVFVFLVDNLEFCRFFTTVFAGSFSLGSCVERW